MSSKLISLPVFVIISFMISFTMSAPTHNYADMLVEPKSYNPTYKEILATELDELEDNLSMPRYRFGKRGLGLRLTRDEKLYAELINFMDKLDLKRY